jgi:hypothetical protein
MRGVCLVLALAISVCVGLNTRPIVGILTQPDPELGTYIAASYVKYIEVDLSHFDRDLIN